MFNTESNEKSNWTNLFFYIIYYIFAFPYPHFQLFRVGHLSPKPPFNTISYNILSHTGSFHFLLGDLLSFATLIFLLLLLLPLLLPLFLPLFLTTSDSSPLITFIISITLKLSQSIFFNFVYYLRFNFVHYHSKQL